MKRSELVQIIKEEISNIISEQDSKLPGESGAEQGVKDAMARNPLNQAMQKKLANYLNKKHPGLHKKPGAIKGFYKKMIMNSLNPSPKSLADLAMEVAKDHGHSPEQKQQPRQAPGKVESGVYKTEVDHAEIVRSQSSLAGRKQLSQLKAAAEKALGKSVKTINQNEKLAFVPIQ